MELLENDAPGFREEPIDKYHDAIWGNNRARKIFFLDDSRANSAWLVFANRQNSEKYPLKILVNGNESNPLDIQNIKSIEWCVWVEFPAEYLKKRGNIIELYCPEAKSEEDGWKLMISPADMYEECGGDPTHVGETSYKSTDGGKTWKKSPFGPSGKRKAEYSVMLSLDRYVKSGWLASPVIDLWKGNSNDFIVPLRQVKKLKLKIESYVPDGTKIDYYFRRGLSPQPFSKEWEPYRKIGNGSNVDFEIDGADPNRRYVQFKAKCQQQSGKEFIKVRTVSSSTRGFNTLEY